MANMLGMINQVRDFMDKDDWKYEYVDDRHLIRSGVNLTCKLQSVKMYISFNENGYTVLVIPAMKADKNSRQNIMEYLTRANYGLRNGNFEMDADDGEIRYKVYVDYKGMKSLSEEVISDSITIPPMMVDRYGDGLAALMFGFSDPLTEIQKVESK